ncbi:MAG: sensor histidine kinase [Planctomycetota bacterium]
MWQFATGFGVVLLVLIPVVLYFLRKKTSQSGGTSSRHLEELQNLSKLTGELAHEIKNPLSTIKINLKLTAEDLRDCDDNGPQGQKCKRALRKISIIQKETDRLEQILAGFLHYITRPQLQLAKSDINSLIGDMVDFYSAQARSHSITIRTGLHNGPLFCKIDADMLKQVILNLFINAQQAMETGGDLIVRTDRRQNDAVIEISDTGTGIEPDRLTSIFDAHYSSRPNGSGLGLPTAKKIIEAHKGTITVNSEPGTGTSFTINLPLSS